VELVWKDKQRTEAS